MKTFLAVLIVVTLALAWRLHVTNDTLVGQEQGLGQQRRTLGALATALAAPTVVVRRISATACFEQGVPGVRAEMRLGNFTPTETEGIGSRRVGNSITLYCPIPSDSMLPHANIDQVEVRGWGSSLCRPAPSTSCPPFVLAYLCVSYHNTASGTCTRFRRSEVRGANFVITFKGDDLLPWTNNPNGYPYMRVDLTIPSWNGDTSTLRGITVSGRGETTVRDRDIVEALKR